MSQHARLVTIFALDFFTTAVVNKLNAYLFSDTMNDESTLLLKRPREYGVVSSPNFYNVFLLGFSFFLLFSVICSSSFIRRTTQTVWNFAE
jgi:hypothetical protein